MANNHLQYGFRLSKRHDRDLIEALGSLKGGEKSERIKELMRKGLLLEQMEKGHAASPTPHAHSPLPYQVTHPPYYYVQPSPHMIQLPPQSPTAPPMEVQTKAEPSREEPPKEKKKEEITFKTAPAQPVEPGKSESSVKKPEPEPQPKKKNVLDAIKQGAKAFDF